MQRPANSAGAPGRIVARSTALFALVLAAGSSSRYGSVKQLLSYRGEILAARAIRTAESLCAARSILITGFSGRDVHAACAPLRGFRVQNHEYRAGIGRSISCGVAAVREAADGILLLLADQPLVAVEHLQALADHWRDNPRCAVASRYADTFGVPAIFPAADFDALVRLDGDRGARSVLESHGNKLQLIDCAAAAVDVDRPADFAALP